MPDISMCEGGSCPVKDMCYRYTATPNEYRQSYFMTPPYSSEGCDMLMRISKQRGMKDVYEQVDADYAGIAG